MNLEVYYYATYSYYFAIMYLGHGLIHQSTPLFDNVDGLCATRCPC